MGLLRYLMAISVVAAHSSPFFGWSGVGGVVAVQSFYMISGFYMGMILTDKYIGENGSYFLFLSNRLLRLLPIYWVVLALSFLHAGGTEFIKSFSQFPLLTQAYIWFGNLSLLGQDLFMFTGVNTDGTLYFTKNFELTNPKFYTFLLIPQAWSLSIEIYFYLLAPAIARLRTKALAAMIAGSIVLRLVLVSNGLYADPWSYRFFPTELAFFCLGILAFKITHNSLGSNWRNLVMRYSAYAILPAVILFQWIPGGRSSKAAVFYLLLFLGLPYLFIITKKNTWDRKVGELSYPVYIVHILIVYILLEHWKKTENFGIYTLSLSTGAAALLIFSISNPIEKYRAHRLKNISSANQASLKPNSSLRTELQ